MKLIQTFRASQPYPGLQGMWLVLVPAPLLLVYRTGAAPDPTITPSILLPALLASLALLSLALLQASRPRLAKGLGVLALVACAHTGWPLVADDPFAALLAGVGLIQAVFFLLDLPTTPTPLPSNREVIAHAQARKGVQALTWLALPALLLNVHHLPLGEQALAASALISQMLVGRCLHTAGTADRYRWAARGIVLLPPLLSLALLALARWLHLLPQFSLALGLGSLWFLQRHPRELHDGRELWWEPFLNHPARVLISTFFGLCLLGSLLLHLPWSSTGPPIAFIDAAFTSVSAVCVTGLTVLDTAGDFSPFGQACILLLIQLGGFGIMTITTVALHALGKRLSLRQERLLTTLTETSHQELISSLVTIVRFTLLSELIGALLLTLGFVRAGSTWHQGLWQGLFTAVSAFCNAGFALNSANLAPYQQSPLILHTVGTLIILGGLAPSTCLLLPQWLRGGRIALAPLLALRTTLVLLVSGTLAFLVFEGDHSLAGLSLVDKLHNAWFQSVTLRTAGFNSVEISAVLPPTLMIMLGWMFIGGSPGGTAGGIKTTTIGVLALTFWACITGRDTVVAHNRTVPQSTINRAVTVFASGLTVLFLSILALSLTQPFPARQLVFEATSALGTVGLSLGITPRLDTIGKIIIMLTMFIGRIGPMTLFTLLSADHQRTEPQCPDARITIT